MPITVNSGRSEPIRHSSAVGVVGKDAWSRSVGIFERRAHAAAIAPEQPNRRIAPASLDAAGLRRSTTPHMPGTCFKVPRLAAYAATASLVADTPVAVTPPTCLDRTHTAENDAVGVGSMQEDGKQYFEKSIHLVPALVSRHVTVGIAYLLRGSAVLYRTCFSAKLERIFSTCAMGESCSRMNRSRDGMSATATRIK